MDFNKVSNNTIKQRLIRSLSHGLRQLEIAGKDKKKSEVGITFYLLKDGRIITFREWYQMDSPSYIVSGTRSGCEKSWIKKEAELKLKELLNKNGVIIKNEGKSIAVVIYTTTNFDSDNNFHQRMFDRIKLIDTDLAHWFSNKLLNSGWIKYTEEEFKAISDFEIFLINETDVVEYGIKKRKIKNIKESE